MHEGNRKVKSEGDTIESISGLRIFPVVEEQGNDTACKSDKARGESAFLLEHVNGSIGKSNPMVAEAKQVIELGKMLGVILGSLP